jgi:hypothetical protein
MIRQCTEADVAAMLAIINDAADRRDPGRLLARALHVGGSVARRVKPDQRTVSPPITATGISLRP